MSNRRAAIRRDKREREKILKSKAPGADMLRIKNEGWEELKELRVAYYKGFKEGKRIGYNKAIDDFEKEMIRSYLTEQEKEYIRYKAEQLKEGGAEE